MRCKIKDRDSGTLPSASREQKKACIIRFDYQSAMKNGGLPYLSLYCMLARRRRIRLHRKVARHRISTAMALVFPYTAG